MIILDPKFLNNKLHYTLQCLAVTFIMFIVTKIIHITLNTALIASLAATTFIVFTMPHKKSSKPRYVLGGYTTSLISGTLCWIIYNFYSLDLALIGAISIGISVFLMVILNTEHPPAAAFAFGIVIDGISYKQLIIVYFVTISFMLIRKYAGKWLIDLL